MQVSPELLLLLPEICFEELAQVTMRMTGKNHRKKKKKSTHLHHQISTFIISIFVPGIYIVSIFVPRIYIGTNKRWSILLSILIQ